MLFTPLFLFEREKSGVVVKTKKKQIKKYSLEEEVQSCKVDYGIIFFSTAPKSF